MSEAKHVPGPYIFEPHNGFGACDDEGEPWPFGYISADGPSPIFELLPIIARTPDELEATAVLFAAAPDLLEAAKAHIAARDALLGAASHQLKADDPRFRAVDDTLAALKAAIAKAEGRS